jgi:hypothetical protein
MMKTLFLMLLIGTSIRAAEPSGGAPALLTKEADLVVLTLKPEAENRLRIQTVIPERKTVSGSVSSRVKLSHRLLRREEPWRLSSGGRLTRC